MRKRTFGRLLGAVLSITMLFTSVVSAQAAGIDTSDVSFFAQNEEIAEETEEVTPEDDLSEETAVVDEEGTETIEAELTDDGDAGEEADEAEYEVTDEEVYAEEGTDADLASAEAVEDADEDLLKSQVPKFTIVANGGAFPDGTEQKEIVIYAYRDLSHAEYIPAIDGKVFVGWYAEAACETKLSSDANILLLEKQPEDGTVIYAKYADSWKITLVYGVEDGTDPLTELGYYYDSDAKQRFRSMALQGAVGTTVAEGLKAAALCKNGPIRNEDPEYSFSGSWYTDEERQNEVDNFFNIEPEGDDAVYYAGYVKDMHVVAVHAGEDGYFTQRVEGHYENPGEYDTYYLLYCISDSGSYSVHESTITNYLENHDVKKTVEGYYFDPDYQNELSFPVDAEPRKELTSDQTDIYINWAVTGHSVTFHAGEGAYLSNYSYATGQYEYSQDLVALNHGSADYYPGIVGSSDQHWGFLGWSTDPDAAEPEYDSGTSTMVYLSDIDEDKDYDLYAIWDKDAYYVATFDATEEGYFEYSEAGVQKKDRYMPVQVDKRSGYLGPSNYKPTCKDSKRSFAEWTVNGEGIGYNYSYRIEEDTTFVATYATAYKIVFYANGSVDKGGYFYDSGMNVKSKEIYATEIGGASYPTPHNDGDYTSDYWYVDKECTIKAYLSYTFFPKEDAVYYADWRKNCTVTFDPGEGKLLEGEATFKRAEGDAVGDSWFTPPTAIPASEDEVFVAWYTDSTFSEESRVSTSEIGSYIVSEGLTFYARFEKACSVTFDLGEDGAFYSEFNPCTIKIPKGEPIGNYVPAVKDMPGKAFIGWFESQEEGAERIADLYKITASEDTTAFYGKYSDSCWTVTFDANLDGAILDESGERAVSFTVPKGKAYGRDYYGTLYSESPELTTIPEGTTKVPLSEDGILAWSIEGDSSGDLYFFDTTVAYRVDSDGEEYRLNYGGFIPTGDTTFLLNWVDEVTITYVTDDEHLFREELNNNSSYEGLSEDRKELYQKVPKGCRFGEIDKPYKYNTEDYPSDLFCRFAYDEGGNRIPDSTKITADLTVTAQWMKEERWTKADNEVMLYAGEGSFRSGSASSKASTAEYNGPGEEMYTSVPEIDDPDRAFLTWCTDPDLEDVYPGQQICRNGWWIIETVSDMPQKLYAKYGPTATVRVDANGGYFDGSASGVTIDPGTETRSRTYYEVKPSVSGTGISLSGYSALIRHDGNLIFGGWTDSDGNPLELTSTDQESQVFVPTQGNSDAIALWTVPGGVEALTLGNDDLILTVGDEPVSLELATAPEGSIDNQNLIWHIQRDPYYGGGSVSVLEPAIVSVSGDGTVTAISEGKVKIWAECNGISSNIATVTVEAVPTPPAEAPTADPGKEGETVNVKKGDVIELSSETEDATILYTLSGKEPVTTLDDAGEPVDADTIKYKGGIAIKDIDPALISDGIVTIMAVAVKEGFEPSAVKTYKYDLKGCNWGDLASDSGNPGLLEAAKGWFGNDSNNVPEGVWITWKPDKSGIYWRLDDPEKPVTIEKEYTSENITFNDEIVVYHNTRKLLENRDYTITYSNNKKAAMSTAAKGAPVVTVNGKGMYSSSKVFKFTINAVDMSESGNVVITSQQKVVVFAGKNVKLSGIKPQLSFGNNTLKEKTDYTLEYFRVVEGAETAVADPAKEILSEDRLVDGRASYRIYARGTGNFTKVLPTPVEVEVIKKDKNTVQVTGLKVTDKNGKAISFSYEKGRAIDPEALFANSDAIVKNGKVTLLYGRDYTVEPVAGYDYTSAGKHNFLIKGVTKGPEDLTEGESIYVGTMTASLEIKPKADISKLKVAGLKTSVEYLGRNYTNDDLDSEKSGALFNSADKSLKQGWKKVTLYNMQGKFAAPFEEGEDYEVEAFSSGVVGKFDIVFKGKNGCTGTLKKTITVKTANFKGKKFTITVDPAKYSKAGAKPDVSVVLEYSEDYAVPLTAGIDYTVTYKNNAKVYDITGKTDKELKAAPTVTIKGMGNYTGSAAAKAFSIEATDPSRIDVFVKDVVYNKKKSGKSGYFIVAPKLMDDGKAVTTGKGKDVNTLDKKSFKYTYDEFTELEDGTEKTAGMEVGAKDKIPAGTTIRVEVPVEIPVGSPYNGTNSVIETTLSGTYRVIATDISKATVTVINPDKLCVRNGEPIELTYEDLEVRFGKGEPLKETDYEIVSITNNRYVGNATLTIRGIGKNYGGTKIVQIKIRTQGVN